MVQQIAEIGKRSGWFKPTEQPPILPENQEEEKNGAWHGRLFAFAFESKSHLTKPNRKWSRRPTNHLDFLLGHGQVQWALELVVVYLD